MTDRVLILLASLNMILAVGAGAFGAHGLQQRVSADLVAVWNTGVLYHLIHALALLILAALAARFGSLTTWVAAFMLAGIVLFSGSLYLLTLTGTRILGAVTPLGGVSFMVGWAL